MLLKARLKESVIQKINVLIWFCFLKKKTTNLNEDKRKEGTHSSEPQKAHLVSLLLWHKIVVLRCFIWPLGLRPWSVNEADKISGFGILKKFYIQSLVSVFLILMLYFMLDGLMLLLKGDFCCVRYL